VLDLAGLIAERGQEAYPSHRSVKSVRVGSTRQRAMSRDAAGESDEPMPHLGGAILPLPLPLDVGLAVQVDLEATYMRAAADAYLVS